MATTLYLEKKDIERDRENLIGLISNKDFELLPMISREFAEPLIMGKKRLIQFRRKNGLPLIMFNNPKDKAVLKLTFKLHKINETSDFSII